MSTEHDGPVIDTIRARLDELTSGERKVARALLADYPAAGLGSAKALADVAGVSTPTVVRLAAHLEFAGFSEMQSRLRHEISERGSSPVLRTLAHGDGQGPRTRFHEAMRHRSAAIDETRVLVPDSEFERACALLGRSTKRVLVTGGFFSAYIGRIFTLQLAQVRPDVVFVDEPLRRDVASVLDTKKGSVLVLFDLRRYEDQAVLLARRAKQAGVRVILITDRWLSPVSETADVVLPVEVEATPFDSFTALLAVAEVLVEAVMHAGSATAIRRMQLWEEGAVEHTRTVGRSPDVL